MSWFSVIKKELPFNELVDEVTDKLEEYLRSNMVVSGDYDDEKEGYRNAETDYLYIAPDAEITVEPSMTHDEDDDITTEYDLYFNENLRLGSYTGTEGHYIAALDWDEDERKDLEELLEALK